MAKKNEPSKPIQINACDNTGFFLKVDMNKHMTARNNFFADK